VSHFPGVRSTTRVIAARPQQWHLMPSYASDSSVENGGHPGVKIGLYHVQAAHVAQMDFWESIYQSTSIFLGVKNQ
jgi:hypothetical protein